MYLAAGALFLFVSILQIVFLKKQNRKGRYLTKPLLVPLLLLFYVFSVDKPDILLIFGLLCGFFGDVFLMGPSDKKTFVLGGIGAFLLGHLFYICAFWETVPSWFWLLLIPYIILGYLVGRKLFPAMTSMKVPAALYMGVILFMSFASLTRLSAVFFPAFLLPFLGSLLFIVSDTLLAFDMFTAQKRADHSAVMVTYILAQFLIVLGFIFL